MPAILHNAFFQLNKIRIVYAIILHCDNLSRGILSYLIRIIIFSLIQFHGVVRSNFF